MLTDIHTHLPAPRPDAVISCQPTALPSGDEWPGQLYSVGIHPWSLTAGGIDDNFSALLEEAVLRDDVVAVGECGIDMSHPGAAPLYQQLLAFRAHIELSEKVGKPLILHCVKAWDSVIALRKEYKPAQRWLIHGFRGKPQVLGMLLKAGIDVSYGENFNPRSVALTPPDRLFAETDESPVPINDVISQLSVSNPAATEERIAANLKQFLNLK